MKSMDITILHDYIHAYTILHFTFDFPKHNFMWLNASAIIPELIRIATNKSFSQNMEKKHRLDAKYGWYRYDTRFALPKYDDSNEICGYNIFRARLVVRHAEDGRLYLYDVLRTKKETSRPHEQ